MEITVNNELKALPPEVSTVAELAKFLNVKPQGTALAINGTIVLKRNWETHSLKEHDNVMVITAAYGG